MPYISKKTRRWRIKTKKRMISILGGKCCICGYSRCRNSLTFHHINPKEKTETIGRLLSKIRPWKRIVEELKKCVLVCTNCHAEIHAGLTKVPKRAIRFKTKKTPRSQEKQKLRLTLSFPPCK